MRMCRRCLTVDGIGWSQHDLCFDRQQHEWSDRFAVVDCPHVERTATGRVSAQRRRAADAACTSEYHHYGDLERRHFALFIGEVVT